MHNSTAAACTILCTVCSRACLPACQVRLRYGLPAACSPNRVVRAFGRLPPLHRGHHNVDGGSITAAPEALGVAARAVLEVGLFAPGILSREQFCGLPAAALVSVLPVWLVASAIQTFWMEGIIHSKKCIVSSRVRAQANYMWWHIHMHGLPAARGTLLRFILHATAASRIILSKGPLAVPGSATTAVVLSINMSNGKFCMIAEVAWAARMHNFVWGNAQGGPR